MDGWNISEEHREYELCKMFWRTPEQIEEMEERKIRLFREFYQEELRVEELKQNRQKQRTKFRNK